ncbi:MAG: hypothetical protein PHW83_12695, partial [Bacteroidales bacterium]|nr:hypothetical protein [Bacteroidales bacterium]
PVAQADEVNTFCDINEIHLTYISDSAANDILVDNEDLLFNAAQSISPLYSAMSEILYSYISDSVFFEYTPLPYEVIAPRNISSLTDTKDKESFMFELYPNPTDNIVYVEYDLSGVYDGATELYHNNIGVEQKGDCRYGKIIVYSNDAKVLEEVALESETGVQKISLRNYVPGQYLIEIRDCYGIIRAKKVSKK